MNSLEMKDAVVYQDEALHHMVDFLNAQVGKGNWVMVMTADHGAMPSPSVSGAFNISAGAIAAQINAHFDHDGDATHVVDLVQPTQIFLNEKELQQNGGTDADVARFIMTLTENETKNYGVTVNPAHANDLVFQAAFPSALMTQLPCLPEASHA
jgi:hypothetical protein